MASGRLINKIENGSIIIAPPFQQQQFSRTCIMIVDHRPKIHSVGMILNLHTDETIKRALPEFDSNKNIFYGGPELTTFAMYIHNCSKVKNTVYLKNGAYWGGDYDSLLKHWKDGICNESNLRFFAGHVLWKGDLLEKELMWKMWWLNRIDIRINDLFAIKHETMWEDLSIRNGKIYGMFADYQDPSDN